MRWQFTTLIFLSLACVCAATAQNRVTVVQTSRDAAPTRQRFLDALSAAGIEMQVNGRPLPRIVLLQTDRKSAAVAGVPEDGKVIAPTLPGLDGPLYLAWTVGTVDDAKLADVAVTILNAAFLVKLTPGQQLLVTRRVIARLGATVTADSLARRQ
ncbi:MAG: hypothetical protein ACRD3E_05930 [Terriglobales bacterium]